MGEGGWCPSVLCTPLPPAPTLAYPGICHVSRRRSPRCFSRPQSFLPAQSKFVLLFDLNTHPWLQTGESLRTRRRVGRGSRSKDRVNVGGGWALDRTQPGVLLCFEFPILTPTPTPTSGPLGSFLECNLKSAMGVSMHCALKDPWWGAPGTQKPEAVDQEGGGAG